MKRAYYTLFILILLIFYPLKSQSPDIGYIIPDIGAPGMNVYLEIIAHNARGNGVFGQDGFYLNRRGDNVWIELINSADSNKIIFGPLVVSWDGRVISTQVFINPKLQPNAKFWDELTAEFRIPFRVVVNGQPTNEVEFYIVQPQNLGDISSNSERVLGEGALGKRSKRGAMIVDSLILANATYTISTVDTDTWELGNQGYLPFILLSKGVIRGGANTRISVNGDSAASGSAGAGGPGGGGGGGRFCDVLTPNSRRGDKGGDGFTGGGPGGNNNVLFGNGRFEQTGTGSGANGNSLNGTLGGKAASAWETAPGGTGHPFGTSGEPCGDGNNCEPNGGYGGGSGAKQNLPGGAGGFATDGASGTGNNGGKAHGNAMVVPIAGGSGGSSGNPQGQEIYSGSGGGGGGAISVYAPFIQNLELTSIGGNGKDGNGNSHGGAGSGGYTGIFTKLGFSNIKMNVSGGYSPAASGGAGRIRYDAPSFQDIFLTSPNDASRYNGITSDTNRIVPRQFTLKGSRNATRNIRAFIKPESGDWVELTNVNYNNREWSINISLDKPDTLFYFFAMQDVPNPSTQQYRYEPIYVMSQAAANIFIVDQYPIIAGDTLKRYKILDCKGVEIYDTTRVYNEGTADLELDFTNTSFEIGSTGWEIISPSGKVIVPPDSSIEVIVHWKGKPAPTSNRLIIPHNDTRGRPNPWKISYIIDLYKFEFVAYDTLYKNILGDFYLGKVCPETEISRAFAFVNLTDSASFTLKQPIFKLYESNFEATLLNNNKVAPKDTAWILVKFKGDFTGINTYVTALVISFEECDDYSDTINVVVDIIRPDLVITGNGDFGEVVIGQASQRTYKIKNNGIGATIINELPTLSPPFRIVSSNPPIPPQLRLNPGNEFEITVEFAPTTIGHSETTLIITGVEGDNACKDTARFQIFGFGIKSDIYVNTDSLNFGVHAWCDSKEDSIIVVCRIKSLRLLSATIEGENKDSFIFSQRPELPIEIFTNDSARFYIKFDPSVGRGGPKTARFVLIYDNYNKIDTIIVHLFGIKEDLNITSDPAMINFGQIPIGYNNELTISLTNNGVIDRWINRIESSIPEITITPQSSYLTGNGGTQIFRITANLNEEKQYSGILTFYFNVPCPDTMTIQVFAEGLKANVSITNPLNFGLVAPCEDKLDSIIIRNPGKAPLIIQNINLTGIDQDYFNLLPSSLPDTLQPGEIFVQRVLFNPQKNARGLKRAVCKIEIELNGTQEIYNVDLIAEAGTGIEIAPNPVDFGGVIVGTSLSKSFRLSNKGPLRVEILNISDFNLPNIFSITPKVSNYLLQPNESIDFTIQFFAESDIKYFDSLAFDFLVNSCNEKLTLLVVGEGIIGDSVHIWFVPDTLVSPSLDEYRHPIYAQKLSSNYNFDNLSFTTEILFDASLFYPLRLTKGRILSNILRQNRTRVLEIRVDSINISTEPLVITEIVGATLLGEIDRTLFKFDKFQWLSQGINYTQLDSGLLRIEICREGGDRLVRMNSPLNMIVSPNPTSDFAEINIQLLEVGLYKLEIINSQGVKVKSFEWLHNIEQDSHINFRLDLSALANGLYFVMLRTPTNTVIDKFIIMK